MMNQVDLSGLKVALVYPPYGPVKNEPGIKAVKENYGIFPSLSLLYVAGILENAGCEVLFIDAHAEDLDLGSPHRRSGASMLVPFSVVLRLLAS